MDVQSDVNSVASLQDMWPPTKDEWESQDVRCGPEAASSFFFPVQEATFTLTAVKHLEDPATEYPSVAVFQAFGLTAPWFREIACQLAFGLGISWLQLHKDYQLFLNGFPLRPRTYLPAYVCHQGRLVVLLRECPLE